jgi:hypothetical protein
MVYFMGQDISVFITTENTVNSDTYVTVTDGGVTTVASGAAAVSDSQTVFAGPLEGPIGFYDGDDFGTPPVENITGLDVSIGAMDEDITYFGFRQVTKAEIKKETTVSLTRKKTDLAYDAIFNGATGGGSTGGGRYGVSGANFLGGLEEPTVNHGYRLHIVLRDGTEVMSIPGCCVQSHTVTTAVDGSADETIEFMTYITPSYGQTPDQAVLTAAEL